MQTCFSKQANEAYPNTFVICILFDAFPNHSIGIKKKTIFLNLLPTHILDDRDQVLYFIAGMAKQVNVTGRAEGWQAPDAKQ